MSGSIEQKSKRLSELERARSNLAFTGHPDDMASYQALALKYLDEPDRADVVSRIGRGLDAVIARARQQLRDELK